MFRYTFELREPDKIKFPKTKLDAQRLSPYSKFFHIFPPIVSFEIGIGEVLISSFYSWGLRHGMCGWHTQVPTSVVIEQVYGSLGPYLLTSGTSHCAIPFLTVSAHPTISAKIVNQGHMPMTPTMSCWSCGDRLWVPLNRFLTRGCLLLAFLLLWNRPGKTIYIYGVFVLWLAFWFWWQGRITKLNSLLGLPLWSIQWLGLCASVAGNTGLIPGWRTELPRAVWHSQKKKTKESP